MAAPEGNENSSLNNRLWANTIRRALVQDPDRLRRIAEAMLDAAEEGNLAAIKEMGDRVDGKVAQTLQGPDGGPAVILAQWLEKSE